MKIAVTYADGQVYQHLATPHNLNCTLSKAA